MSEELNGVKKPETGQTAAGELNEAQQSGVREEPEKTEGLGQESSSAQRAAEPADAIEPSAEAAGDELDDLFLSPDEDSEGLIDMPSDPQDLDISGAETEAESVDPAAEELQQRAEQIAELEAELEEARQQGEEHRERWMRASADLENLRKRTRRERADVQKYGHDKFSLELVQVVDNLERALAHADKVADQSGIVDGVEMVYRQLVGALGKFGVVEIDARGQKFDPEKHEAIQQVETPDAETGTVVEQYQKGYFIHDRLLRPAMVSVAKKVAASNNEEPSKVDQSSGEESESDDSGTGQ